MHPRRTGMATPEAVYEDMHTAVVNTSGSSMKPDIIERTHGVHNEREESTMPVRIPAVRAA